MMGEEGRRCRRTQHRFGGGHCHCLLMTMTLCFAIDVGVDVGRQVGFRDLWYLVYVEQVGG
jgi:hypothetical protein